MNKKNLWPHIRCRGVHAIARERKRETERMNKWKLLAENIAFSTIPKPKMVCTRGERTKENETNQTKIIHVFVWTWKRRENGLYECKANAHATNVRLTQVFWISKIWTMHRSSSSASSPSSLCSAFCSIAKSVSLYVLRAWIDDDGDDDDCTYWILFTIKLRYEVTFSKNQRRRRRRRWVASSSNTLRLSHWQQHHYQHQ